MEGGRERGGEGRTLRGRRSEGEKRRRGEDAEREEERGGEVKGRFRGDNVRWDHDVVGGFYFSSRRSIN